MSCKHGNYEGINGRDCDLCDAEDEIWKLCAAKDVEIADLKAAYESLFKENAARRAAALASPAPAAGEPAVEAILFALATDDPKSFLTAWVHGDWDVIRKEWPEAPEATIATPPAAPAATTEGGA